jgi:diguanylate cyclase (GGDEF)-like protein
MAVAKWKDESARVGVRDQAERFFETIVELLDDGIIVMRNDGSVKFVNPAARRILGLEPEHTLADFATRAALLPLFDADGVPVPNELRAVGQLRLPLSFSRQIYAVDLPNGERRWLLINGCPVRLDDSDDVDALISFSDVTSQHAAVERLMHQANHDPLTGLPNRAYVLRRITEALAATDGVRLRAVLFIDLDDLKTTNDTLGHDAGDELLRAAAARLRQGAGPADVVGRHGGDEFVVLIFGTATRGGLTALVERLRSRLAEPVVVADTKTPIRASVGLVEVDDDDNRTAEEILRDADRAMYAAKRAGRGGLPG